MTVLTERIVEVREALETNVRRLADAQSRLQETRAEVSAGRSRRQQLHDLAFARLVAQLETMPVIEQAKGILMAQSGCGPEEAFDMLRRASQRSNVRVCDLAATIVERTSKGPSQAGRPAAPRQRPARAAISPQRG